MWMPYPNTFNGRFSEVIDWHIVNIGQTLSTGTGHSAAGVFLMPPTPP